MQVDLTHLTKLRLYEREKPYELWLPTGPGVAKTNCAFSSSRVLLRDVRSKDLKCTIDTTGFEFVNHVSQNKNLLTGGDEGLESAVLPYLEETLELVRKIFSAHKVIVNDWRV